MRNIDGKFSTDGSRIFNTVSGEEIPEDEPLFLLRARDVLAMPTICYYMELAGKSTNDLHQAGVRQVIRDFGEFSISNPDRMKEPGKTRHLKLKED